MIIYHKKMCTWYYPSPFCWHFTDRNIHVSLKFDKCNVLKQKFLHFIFWIGIQLYFPSPELKAQVSFSDHLSSFVCLLSVCKLFTFSSSSPEPHGQFQPNLAQSNLGWRGLKFLKMKGRALFQGEIIMK